jgi:hypothetical protein
MQGFGSALPGPQSWPTTRRGTPPGLGGCRLAAATIGFHAKSALRQSMWPPGVTSFQEPDYIRGRLNDAAARSGQDDQLSSSGLDLSASGRISPVAAPNFSRLASKPCLRLNPGTSARSCFFSVYSVFFCLKRNNCGGPEIRDHDVMLLDLMLLLLRCINSRTNILCLVLEFFEFNFHLNKLVWKIPKISEISR